MPVKEATNEGVQFKSDSFKSWMEKDSGNKEKGRGFFSQSRSAHSIKAAAAQFNSDSPMAAPFYPASTPCRSRSETTSVAVREPISEQSIS